MKSTSWAAFLFAALPLVAGDLAPRGPELTPLFVRAQGNKLVVGRRNRPIYLRGINFSYDRVKDDDPTSDWRMADHTDWGSPVTEWYQARHYRLAHEIGFNVVRLNLSYRIFEDNATPGQWKQSGWDLLNRIIGWARQTDLYLILDMHVAPGGAGISSCQGCGWRTWEQARARKRFVALWREIARRFVREPRIAAYDLLNEPVPTHSPGQWKDLAQMLVAAIRQVDRNHLLILEMPVWIYDRTNRSSLSDYDSAVLRSFQFTLQDSNVMYDHHFYLPAAYTLQDETGVDGGKYPDASRKERTIRGSAMKRDLAYLRSELATITEFWRTRGVPINIGEWGCADSLLSKDQRKGGIQYVHDMLKLMKESHVNWQFYYMNRLYRIDCCHDNNPTRVIDQRVINEFRTSLSSPR